MKEHSKAIDLYSVIRMLKFTSVFILFRHISTTLSTILVELVLNEKLLRNL